MIARSAEDLDRTSTVRYKKILDRLSGTKKKVQTIAGIFE